jgi:hypothetical protein
MAGTAARPINMAGFDITSTASTVSLGDTGSYTIGTMVAQITMTDGVLVLQGTLGTQAAGVYATLGYTVIGDPGTVITTGLISASCIIRIFGDALSDVRVKVSTGGTITPSILVRPVAG